jgi:hypothetical protein
MLLHRIDFKHQTPLALFESLSHGHDIVLVSDGAADHLQGAAGWVLAIGSTRVCTGQLAVPGYDPRSYRAEGYGMIGGLLFLHHLSLYCNRLNTIPLKTIYCDNEGLIKKVMKLFTFRLASTAAALHSEYNVLATKKTLITGLSPQHPDLTHVKGH